MTTNICIKTKFHTVETQIEYANYPTEAEIFPADVYIMRIIEASNEHGTLHVEVSSQNAYELLSDVMDCVRNLDDQTQDAAQSKQDLYSMNFKDRPESLFRQFYDPNVSDEAEVYIWLQGIRNTIRGLETSLQTRETALSTISSLIYDHPKLAKPTMTMDNSSYSPAIIFMWNNHKNEKIKIICNETDVRLCTSQAEKLGE